MMVENVIALQEGGMRSFAVALTTVKRHARHNDAKYSIDRRKLPSTSHLQRHTDPPTPKSAQVDTTATTDFKQTSCASVLSSSDR